MTFLLHEYHVAHVVTENRRPSDIMCGKVKIAEISHERSKYLLLLNLGHVYVQWE